MSRICKNFQENTWNKDLCANCLKSRQQHEPVVASADTSYETVNVFCQIPGATSAQHEETSPLDGPSSPPDLVQSCHDYENDCVLGPVEKDTIEKTAVGECSLLDEVLGAVKDSTVASHYYHTYDTTMRDNHVPAQTCGSKLSTESTSVSTVPYNVVDVTSKIPDDPLSKPKVPHNKPDVSFGGSRGAAANKRSAFHGDVIRSTSPAVMRSKQANVVSESLANTADAYEEIEVTEDTNIDIVGNMKEVAKVRSEFARQSPARASQGKSTAIQAKIAVLGDLDISKQKDSSSDKETSPSLKKKEISIDNQKSSKQKKGFFSRWLKKSTQSESGDSLSSSIDLDRNYRSVTQSTDDLDSAPQSPLTSAKSTSSTVTQSKLLASDLQSSIQQKGTFSVMRTSSYQERSDKNTEQQNLNRAQSHPSKPMTITKRSDINIDDGHTDTQSRLHTDRKAKVSTDESSLTNSLSDTLRQSKRKPEKPIKPGSAPPPPPMSPKPQVKSSSATLPNRSEYEANLKMSSPTKHVTLNLSNELHGTTSGGKLRISSPKLQRTSVNLEASLSVTDSPVDAMTPPTSPGRIATQRMSSAPPPPPETNRVSPKSLSPVSALKRASSGATQRSMSCDASVTRPQSPPPEPPSTGIAKNARSGLFSLDSKRQSSLDKSLDRTKQKYHTVSEGISVDVADSETQPLLSTLGRHSQKYSQRALPSPPRKGSPSGKTSPGRRSSPSRTKVKGLTRRSRSGEREHYYETLPSDDDARPNGWSNHLKPASYDGCMYEDIPDDQLLTVPGNGYGIPTNLSTSSEYLEPIEHNDSSLLSEMNLFEDGTPIPGPRLPRQHATVTSNGAQYVLLYANKEILTDKSKPATDIEAGYFHMASVNLETLHRLADKIYRQILAPIHTKCSNFKLHFSDFVAANTKPTISQPGVAFYKVQGHTAKTIHLTEFMIMITNTPLPCDVVDFGHVNLVSPVTLFKDSVSTDFLSPSTDPTISSTITTTLALLRYSSLASLSVYMREVRKLMKSSQEMYERIVVYVFAQILNGLLYLYDDGFAVAGITAKQVLVATLCGSDEKVIILNPHGRTARSIKLSLKDACTQVIDLLAVFLAPPQYSSEGRRLTRQSTLGESGRLNQQNSTKYSQGFTRIRELLEKASLDNMIAARNVAEMMMWGPSPSDLPIIQVSEDVEMACSVWLETQRCQIVNRFALNDADNSIEEANYIKFLCAATGSMVHNTLSIIEEGV